MLILTTATLLALVGIMVFNLKSSNEVFDSIYDQTTIAQWTHVLERVPGIGTTVNHSSLPVGGSGVAHSQFHH